MNIVSIIQKHCATEDHKSEVLLIRDDDGLFKILKERVSYSSFPGYLDEDVVLNKLSIHSFVPRFYGITTINNKEYIRRSFVYGQHLSDCCIGNTQLSKHTARYIIFDIARKLKMLEDLNILYLDLKPDNIIFTNQAYFFDLGLCRYKDNDETFRAIMSHPRYTAPEIERGLNSKSIVFQLGIIAHELLYGYHPANEHADVKNMDWSYCMIKYFNQMIKKNELDVQDPFIKKMLSFQNSERPLIEECIDYFSTPVDVTTLERKFRPNGKTVLFPARMGIPHYGHIQYISRLIDLGYKVIVSVQRSYTLTETDPIPKWLVYKMVAQSLFNMGYSEECFDFYLTPFYKDDSSTKMHFSTLPQKFDEVASSNPSVEELFPSYSMIMQKDVFGIENKEYTDLSWGAQLREAVKNNDYEMFKKYAASGVEDILSFDEIVKTYPKRDILFVYNPGSVIVELLDEEFKTILQKNVYRFSTPELCIDRNIINRYSKNPTITINDRKVVIEYLDFTYTHNNLIIRYKIKST